MTQNRKLVIFTVENRFSIVAFTIALTIFGFAFAYAYNQVEQGKKAYHLAKTRLHDNYDFTRGHLDDLSYLEKNKSAFTEWQASGKFGQTDEMAWVELVLDISSNIDAEDFRHSLSEVVAVNKIHGQNVQHTTISQMEIKLDFVAKHGAAVFQYFSEVSARAPSAYEVHSFEIERIETILTKTEARGESKSLNATGDGISPSLQIGSVPRLDLSDQSMIENSMVFEGVRVSAKLRCIQIELLL